MLTNYLTAYLHCSLRRQNYNATTTVLSNDIVISNMVIGVLDALYYAEIVVDYYTGI